MKKKKKKYPISDSSVGATGLLLKEISEERLT